MPQNAPRHAHIPHRRSPQEAALTFPSDPICGTPPSQTLRATGSAPAGNMGMQRASSPPLGERRPVSVGSMLGALGASSSPLSAASGSPEKKRSMVAGISRTRTGGIVPLQPIRPTGALAASAVGKVGGSAKVIEGVKHKAASALRVPAERRKSSSPGRSRSMRSPSLAGMLPRPNPHVDFDNYRTHVMSPVLPGAHLAHSLRRD